MKKLLSFVLALAMVFACVSMVTFGNILTVSAAQPENVIAIRYSKPSSTSYTLARFPLSNCFEASDLYGGNYQFARNIMVHNLGDEARKVTIYVRDTVGTGNNGTPYNIASQTLTIQPGSFAEFELNGGASKSKDYLSAVVFRIDVGPAEGSGQVDGDLLFYCANGTPVDKFMQGMVESADGNDFFTYVTADDAAAVAAIASVGNAVSFTGVNKHDFYNRYGGAGILVGEPVENDKITKVFHVRNNMGVKISIRARLQAAANTNTTDYTALTDIEPGEMGDVTIVQPIENGLARMNNGTTYPIESVYVRFETRQYGQSPSDANCATDFTIWTNRASDAPLLKTTKLANATTATGTFTTETEGVPTPVPTATPTPASTPASTPAVDPDTLVDPDTAIAVRYSRPANPSVANRYAFALTNAIESTDLYGGNNNFARTYVIHNLGAEARRVQIQVRDSSTIGSITKTIAAGSYAVFPLSANIGSKDPATLTFRIDVGTEASMTTQVDGNLLIWCANGDPVDKFLEGMALDCNSPDFFSFVTAEDTDAAAAIASVPAAASFTTMTSVDTYNRYNGEGILTGVPIVNNTITKVFYVKNTGSEAIFVRARLQSATNMKGYGLNWITIAPGKTARIPLTATVNGNNISYTDGSAYTSPIDSFYVRFDTVLDSNHTAAATDYVIWTDRASDAVLLGQMNASKASLVAVPLSASDIEGVEITTTDWYASTHGKNLGFTQADIASFIAAGKIERFFTVYNLGAEAIDIKAYMQWNYSDLFGTQAVTIPAGKAAVVKMVAPINNAGQITNFTPDTTAAVYDTTVGTMRVKDGKVIMQTLGTPDNTNFEYRFDIPTGGHVLIVPQDDSDLARLFNLNNTGIILVAETPAYSIEENPIAIQGLPDKDDIDSYGSWCSSKGEEDIIRESATGFDGGFAVKATFSDFNGQDRNAYEALTYNISAAIFPASFGTPYHYAQYNGAGAGAVEYTVSFWARLDSDSAVTKPISVFLQPFVGVKEGDYPNAVVPSGNGYTRDVNLTGSQISEIELTNVWKYYSLTFTVSQDVVDALEAYDMNNPGQAALLLRFDASAEGSLWNNHQPIPYLVDEITVGTTTELAGNGNLKLTAGSPIVDLADEVLVQVDDTPVLPGVSGEYNIQAGKEVKISVPDAGTDLIGLRIGNSLIAADEDGFVTFLMPVYTVEYEVVAKASTSASVSFVANGKVCAVKTLDTAWTSLPSAPNRFGYTFVGWKAGETTYTDAAAAYAVAGSYESFTAVYNNDHVTVTVTTNANAEIIVNGTTYTETSRTVSPMTIVCPPTMTSLLNAASLLPSSFIQVR